MNLLALALGLSCIAQAPAPQAGAIAVRVGDQACTRADFADWLVHELGESYARAFVDHKVFRSEAEGLGMADVEAEALQKMEAEIQERIDKAYGGDASKWQAEIQQAGRTEAGRRAQRSLELQRDLWLRNASAHGRVVPEEKITREWERRYGLGGRRYSVRLLFRRLVSPPLTGMSHEEQVRERDRLRGELEQATAALAERARAGEPFPKLVAQFSEDVRTRGRGGEPEGGFLDTTGWPADAVAALAELEPGEFSRPLFAFGGFWVVELRDRVETPLETVADELRRDLEARGPETDELAATAERLRAATPWELLPGLSAAGPADPKAPVLRIGGVDVPRAEYADWLLVAAGDAVARRYGELKHLERLAAEAGVEPTPEDLAARVEQTLEQVIALAYKGDRERWERELVASGGTLESWRRQAERQALADERLQGLWERSLEVTEEDAQRAWRERYGEGGVSLELRMIRIDTRAVAAPPDATKSELEKLSAAAIKEAQELAQDVARRAKEGEDFQALARAHSTDGATAAAGGVLPRGFRPDQFPQPVFEAIQKLRPGQVSDAISIGLQNFIIELIGRREVPFESVKEALLKELREREPNQIELRSLMNTLMRDVKVVVEPGLFE
jgi:parvulin-like peptidyl-prolyl isomerase